jgi:hypothetical protein
VSKERKMKKLLFHRLVFLAMIALGLLSNTTGIVFAQNGPPVRIVDLSLADLGVTTPLSLVGPFSQYTLEFNLPSDWRVPAQNIMLSLDIVSFFSSIVPAENQEEISGLIGGNLSIILNGTPILIQTLQESGEKTIQIEFDASLLKPPSRQSVNELSFKWDGSTSCRLMNLLSSITVQPSSSLSLSYLVGSVPYSLNDFPVPFVISNSILPKPLYLTLPSEPSVNELRAALIVAAGIGRFSHGQQKIYVLSKNDKKPASGDLSISFVEWDTPAASDLRDGTLGEGEGVIDFLEVEDNSIFLRIGGVGDGIIKAAQVASTGQLTTTNNALIISEVNVPSPSVESEDLSLQELDAGELLFSPETGLAHSFDFFIPTGSQAKPDAALYLILSHAQQLDYLRSGLEIRLNGYPTASLRLNDSTSNQALFHLILPSNLTHPGRNTIELISTLANRDICSEVSKASAWLRVSASSVLHMPLEATTETALSTKTFGDFPNQYLSGAGLDNVMFLIPPNDPASWSAAGELAFHLGAALSGQDPINLQVLSADNAEVALLEAYSVIEIGKPLDLPLLSTGDQFPALAFTDENLLSETSGIEMITKPVGTMDVGYAAIRGYTGAPHRILLAVLGNSAQGLNLAVDSIFASELESNNFTIATDENVHSSWMDEAIARGKVIESATEDTSQVAPESDFALEFRKKLLTWVIPAMLVLLVMIIVVTFFEIKRRFRN